MSSRKTLSYEASGSAIALALALLPQTAFAQSTQPTAPQQEDVGRPVTAPEKADAAEGQTPENVIVVTGFRGALQSAVSEKKRSA
ncbi:hypothetical protein [Erythrobacter sp. 3-20A1M]|uniref:hypothetical protein n=1 Tax=Erythrobacter sp. 3-20A1M TaxID=2653850 RepID=UPI00203E14A4|nr:hypothetical protein [Erythrobacter sp. 3-20A1M]